MTTMRRAARVDSNQSKIVEELRMSGCKVQPLHTVGRGCPDLVVWSPYKCRVMLMEIKDGSKPPSARRLTKDELAWHEAWDDARRAGALAVVESVEDALLTVGAVS